MGGAGRLGAPPGRGIAGGAATGRGGGFLGAPMGVWAVSGGFEKSVTTIFSFVLFGLRENAWWGVLYNGSRIEITREWRLNRGVAGTGRARNRVLRCGLCRRVRLGGSG